MALSAITTVVCSLVLAAPAAATQVPVETSVEVGVSGSFMPTGAMTGAHAQLDRGPYGFVLGVSRLDYSWLDGTESSYVQKEGTGLLLSLQARRYLNGVEARGLWAGAGGSAAYLTRDIEEWADGTQMYTSSGDEIGFMPSVHAGYRMVLARHLVVEPEAYAGFVAGYSQWEWVFVGLGLSAGYRF